MRGRHAVRRWLAVGAVAVALTAVIRPAAASVHAKVVAETTTPFATDARVSPPMPSFDAGGVLSWEASQSQASPGDCVPSAPPAVVLGAPRVLLWRCANPPLRRLVGVASDGMRWMRALEHVSGPHRIGLFVGSARADALTLSTLEVLDPATGESAVAPPLRQVDAPPRPMPVFGLSGPVTCPRDEGACYGYVGEGTPAGLLRIMRDGRTTVLEKPQSSWFAPIVANDLQLSADGRLLFVAETWLFRGTKWVRFAIVDLEVGKRVFEQRYGEGRVVSDPRVILGPAGQVALVYRDDTAGRHVALSYRVRR